MKTVAVVVAVAASAVLLLLLSSSGSAWREDALGAAPAVAAAGPVPESSGGAKAGTPSAAPEGRLAGIVLDAGGATVPAAVVAARAIGEGGWPEPYGTAPTATADELGRFSFPELAPGVYWLEVRDGRGWGFLPAVPVRPTGSREATIRLLPEASIAGVVEDESGAGVAGATVTTDLSGFLRLLVARTGRPDPGEEASFSATTDGHGAFRLERLPIGRYDLRVMAPGRAERLVPGVVAPVDGVRLTMWRGHSVPVTVTWFGGKPPTEVRVTTDPPDAAVTLVPDGGSAEGVLAGLPEGRLRIVASAEGYAPQVEEVEIVAGRNPPEARLRLGGGLHVRGEVRDSLHRRPLPGARIEVRPWSWSALPADAPVLTLLADDRGKYETRLPEGAWWIVASAPGCRIRSFGLDLDRRGASNADIELVPVKTVAGTVRSEDGVPVPEARVVLRPTPEGETPDERLVRTATADADGTFRFEESLPSASFSLVATAPDGRTGRRDGVEYPEWKETRRVDIVVKSAGRGGVRGRLLNEREEPVARALILLPGRTEVADADGRFAIDDVPSGRRAGWILAAGHPPRPLSVDFPAEGVADLGEIVLPWSDPTVWGRAKATDGAPFGGARVRLLDPRTGETVAETLTRPDGVFGVAWPLPRDAEAILAVTAPGRVADPRRGGFDSLGRGSDFVLSAPGRLRGRVRLKENAIRLRVTLSEVETNRVSRRDVRLDRRSEFLLRDVAPGRYRVVMEPEYERLDRIVRGPRIEAGPIEVPAGDEADLGTIRDR